MALKIRLRQQGRANRQTFRLVVTDIRNPRDGKYLEAVGSYNPFQKEGNFQVDAERLQHWLDLGANLSENAQKLLTKVAPNVIKALKEKEHQKRIKYTAKRRNLKKANLKGAVKAAVKPKAAAAKPAVKKAKKKVVDAN